MEKDPHSQRGESEIDGANTKTVVDAPTLPERAIQETAGLDSKGNATSPLDAEPPCALCEGTVLASRFTIRRLIARGGMGAVYEADDNALHTRVAVKVLEGKATRDSTMMERFRREVRLARRVTHLNVCRVYEFYESNTITDAPLYFFTMEYLEGETLAARIRRHGRLTTAEALPLVQQMCDGLDAAHSQGIIHRDFKSGNVIVGPSVGGQVRVAITDFGIAKPLAKPSEGSSEPATREAALVGTPAYMAPEQVTGGDVCPATDVYALGVVMYEMVTGKLPFSAETPLSMAARHIDEAPPRLDVVAPGLDPRWSRAILRALDLDPDHRFKRAGDLSEALLERRPRRQRLLAFTLVSVLLLAIGGGVAAWKWKVVPRGPDATSVVPSVAVLPFVDMSPEHDQEYFSDGVAQEIIGALTQLPGLHVVARSSSFSFRGKTEDLRAVGQKLNVGHVLEGSVRKSGGRLRVTAQLISASDGYQLWSQTFDRELADVFAVQDEIAKAIATALSVRILPNVGRFANEHPETKPEVYFRYLRGLEFSNSGTLDGYRRAEAQFREAIALDPQFARAHASLALALVWYGIEAEATEVLDPDWSEHALQEASIAAALDPNLADAYVARGIVHNLADWDWPAAKSDFERALNLAPGNTYGLVPYTVLLATLGKTREALETARLAVELDPLSATAYYTLGFIYIGLGHYSAARVATERGVSLAPDHVWAFLPGWVELMAGDPKQALTIFQHCSRNWARRWGVALAQHTLGNEADSRKALEELIANSSQVAPYHIATVYAWRGEPDRAFEWLERAYTVRDSGLPLLGFNPLVQSLHRDPRYAAMLAKLKLPPN